MPSSWEQAFLFSARVVFGGTTIGIMLKDQPQCCETCDSIDHGSVLTALLHSSISPGPHPLLPSLLFSTEHFFLVKTLINFRLSEFGPRETKLYDSKTSISFRMLSRLTDIHIF